MATFVDLLQEVRLQLPDDLRRRWTDADLLALSLRSFRRLNHLLFRNSLSVGKTYATISTVIGQSSYALPADFMAIDGLFRDDKQPLAMIDDRTYQSLVSAPECSQYLLRGANVLIAETPQSVRNLTLVYWPLLSTSTLTVASATPYSGKFDDLMSAFMLMLCQSVDGGGGTASAEFYKDLESSILETYAHLNPTLVRQRGWT